MPVLEDQIRNLEQHLQAAHTEAVLLRDGAVAEVCSLHAFVQTLSGDIQHVHGS